MKCRASELAGLDTTSNDALELDLACTAKLIDWENKRDIDKLKTLYRLVYQAVGAGFAGQELPPLFEED